MNVTGTSLCMRHTLVVVRMPKSLRNELKHVGNRKDLSLSQVLELAAEHYIDMQKPPLEMILWPESEIRHG